MKCERNVLWLIVVLAGLAACSTTLTSVDKDGGNVYALPPTVVDQMLKDAMSTEISTGTLRRGSTPYPSYLGEVTWGSLDKDTLQHRPGLPRDASSTERLSTGMYLRFLEKELLQRPASQRSNGYSLSYKMMPN